MAEFRVPFNVGEDCAGLGTGYLALQRAARRIQRKRRSPIRRGKYTCRLRLKLKYTSESNPQLRTFLHSKYKKHRGNGRDKSYSTKTVIAEDCATGSHDGGDKYLGTDGQLDLYMTGSQCQPFSKMGKNVAEQMSAVTQCATQSASS